MLAKRLLLVSAGLVCLSQLPRAASAQTFITAWGSQGNGVGQFQGPEGQGPVGVAVGGTGDVYVVDGGRLQVFTNGGSFLRMWPVPSQMIAVDGGDNIYVEDQSLIRKYSSSGTLLTQWDTGFGSPRLAVDGVGNVYAADFLGRHIVVYNSSGVYLREWFMPNTSPDGLAVDAAGNVYVADKTHSRIVKFASDGTQISQWVSGQLQLPVRVAIDPQGNVCVVDNRAARVVVFTNTGVLLTQWGSPGSAPGQFDNPIGIAADSNGGIYVADTNNYRIQKFGLAPTPVASMTWGSMKARYRGAPGAAQPAPQDR